MALSSLLKKQFHRYAISLTCLLMLTACADKQPEVYREQLFAFGTIIDISLSDVSPEQAAQAMEILNDDFNYMHVTWNPWQRSALGRTNGLLETTAPFTVAPSVLPLIKRAHELSRDSNGLFNPAIGKLIRLWGFHTENSGNSFPPEPEAIKALIDKRPSMDDLIIDGIRMHTDNKAVLIDLGAFAKGYGVDVAIKHLREMGINNAIINAGGDLRAIGKHGNRPWRIGIRHPRNEKILASLEIQGDESVFTSGDYERFFEYEGRRYHHIIDPRSGYPADKTMSVTVIHRDGATADAAATALFIAGPKQWHAIAKKMGIKMVMLVAPDGTVHMNPAMAKRIQFEIQPAPKVIISPSL